MGGPRPATWHPLGIGDLRSCNFLTLISDINVWITAKRRLLNSRSVSESEDDRLMLAELLDDETLLTAG